MAQLLTHPTLLLQIQRGEKQQTLQERKVTIVEGLNIHVGFIGFNDDSGVTFGELVAFKFDPGDDFTPRHGGGECRHEDFADFGADFGGGSGGGEEVWRRLPCEVEMEEFVGLSYETRCSELGTEESDRKQKYIQRWCCCHVIVVLNFVHKEEEDEEFRV